MTITAKVYTSDPSLQGSEFSKSVLETIFSFAAWILGFENEAGSMLIGYARVSTQDQNLELQTAALGQAGCEKIFYDKLSGRFAQRPGLDQALGILRAGDTLVVWKLDRLGRSVKQLVDLVASLHDQKVHFKSLTDSIDTSTPSGRFFFHVMASLAEMERELIVERTRAGLEVARKAGRVGGRKRALTESKVESAKKLLASGVSAREVAKNLGVSLPTLYRWLPASERAPHHEWPQAGAVSNG